MSTAAFTIEHEIAITCVDNPFLLIAFSKSVVRVFVSLAICIVVKSFLIWSRLECWHRYRVKAKSSSSSRL